jgi:spermidine synthase
VRHGRSHRAARSEHSRLLASAKISRHLIRATAAAFFFSGFSALFYQIIWLRKLTTIFGNTTLAISITLAAFMAGLAIGSYAFGRRADRVARPLRLYGWLEIMIGVYCLGSLALLNAVHMSYVSLAHRLAFDSPWLVSFQFWASFLVLVAPTALMGGTLPVAIRGLVRDLEAIGPQVGRLYGINTLGAAVGVLCVGFFLLPVLGLQGSVRLAAAINVAVGLAMLRLDARTARPEAPVRSRDTSRPGPAEGSLSRPLLAALAIGFAFSGFSGLALEVVWTRALSLYTGSSVYAFSAILLSVLVGIALGSLLVGRCLGHRQITPAWFAATQLGAGASTLILVLAYNGLAFVFLRLVVSFQKSYPLLLALQVLVIMGCLALPTLLSGAAFPIATRIWVQRSSAVSQGVGSLYAANTVGCIGGALAAGFLLIPRIGLRSTVLLCAGLYVLTGAAVLLGGRGRARLLAGLSLALLTVAVLFLPGWSPELMISQFFRAPAPSAERPASIVVKAERALAEGGRKILFYREGSLATVAVYQRLDTRALAVNGKVDASDGAFDMSTQLLLAHLPLLIAPNAKSVLVVGLGSGTTCGAAGLYRVDNIDCVEIEPAVAQAARYFERVNRGVLSDPRFHLIIADARNYLAATRRRYDVITSEPSNPWIAGVASLFTVEHFQALHDSLSDDGVVCQWLQLYSMAPRDIASVISSFVRVFPDATLWWVAWNHADVALIAQKRPWKVDVPRLIARCQQNPQIQEDLRRARFDSPLSLLSYLVFGPADLRRLADIGQLNTDDFPSLEFSTPLSLYRNWEATAEEIMLFLASWKSEPLEDIVDLGPAGRIAENRVSLADSFLNHHPPVVRRAMYLPWTRAELAAAVALAPERADLYEKLARIELEIGDVSSARLHLQTALAHAPKRKSARDLLATLGR